MLQSSPEFIELQEVLAGRFSIEREIGRGGMGIVFLARDVRLERHVAIKLLAPALAMRADMRRRFLREARIAAQCFHPNIVPIHSVEEQGNLAWFVMSYVRGETLAQRVARTGALSPELVERVAREMGWALAYAHERGVVHRDIKPENILLEQGTDRSLLSDFGIAFVDDPTRTTPTGEVAGTASYMAPEQALGESVDGRADIYALGVTLFVAATGRHPFSGASSMAMVVQHALTQAPPTQSLARSLPATLADAIDRCMAKSPDHRFATATDFLRSLEQLSVRPTLSREALAVQNSARATEALLGWSAVTGLTTWLFVIGENSSFGRGIMASIGTGIATLFAAAALLRTAEMLFATRHALKGGANADDVVSSITGETPPGESLPLRKRVANGVAAAAGVALALSQGTISSSDVQLPSAIASLLQVALTVVPPFLVGRGLHEAFANSRVSAFARRNLMAPIGRTVVRLFGATPASTADSDARLAASPTEVVLDNAAHELLAALPPAVRSGLTELPNAIDSLSRDAERLRRAERHLIDAARAARAEGHDESHPLLRSIADQRDAIRSRLATTIAALEAIRLDLMRLAVGAVDASSLTTHLQVARDLEHRLAADAEVRELLAPSYPAGAST